MDREHDMVEERVARMGRVKRLVVKIGSSSLTGPRDLDRRLMGRLVEEVVELRRRGLEVALVSSGAVAAGLGRLGLTGRPQGISELQAVAAVGQNLLMHAYESLFAQYQVTVGQVLLTAGDILDDRRRYLNLQRTLFQLFAYRVVPVVNENDSVAVAELQRTIGENDVLAAYVANLAQAQLLVILSDVEGLYEDYGPEGPRSGLIDQIHYGDPRLEAVAGGSNSKVGRGGMKTKVQAAQLLMACGEMTVIAHARRHRLVDIVEGAGVGTLFVPSDRRLKSRKRWIAFASPCKGELVIDQGARQAIVGQGKSLLPAGVIASRGCFGRGDMVRVEDAGGEEVGRGLSRYTSAEIKRIAGKTSAQIERELARPALVVVHRDDLVLWAEMPAAKA